MELAHARFSTRDAGVPESSSFLANWSSGKPRLRMESRYSSRIPPVSVPPSGLELVQCLPGIKVEAVGAHDASRDSVQ
jgi:hypothetical protein